MKQHYKVLETFFLFLNVIVLTNKNKSFYYRAGPISPLPAKGRAWTLILEPVYHPGLFSPA